MRQIPTSNTRLSASGPAPLGDELSALGRIRADLQRRGLLDGLGGHDLGPQFSPGKSEATQYDGFTASEVLISGPSGDDLTRARKHRRDDQLRSLARRAANAMRALPGYSFDHAASLRQLVTDYGHPWLREQREIEQTERSRCEGVGKPLPVDEPATELAARLMKSISTMTRALRHRREADAMTDDERLVHEIERELQRNLYREVPCTDSEIARSLETNRMRVGRVRKRLKQRDV